MVQGASIVASWGSGLKYQTYVQHDMRSWQRATRLWQFLKTGHKNGKHLCESETGVQFPCMDWTFRIDSWGRSNFLLILVVPSYGGQLWHTVTVDPPRNEGYMVIQFTLALGSLQTTNLEFSVFLWSVAAQRSQWDSQGTWPTFAILLLMETIWEIVLWCAPIILCINMCIYNIIIYI